MENELRCRLCSKTETTTSMIDIFDEENIGRKINSYLSLEVRRDDGLPTSICILCYGKVDNFHNFVLSVHKVQDDLASAMIKKEILPGIKLENDEKISFEYESEGIPNGDMEIDIEIQRSSTKIKPGKRRKSITECIRKRKSNRGKIHAAKKDACIQAGTSLFSDLENLKKDLNLKHRNLQGCEILALLPVAESALGAPVSKDTETSKSCLARLNLGVKTKSGEILMAPNSGTNSKKLIKLPPPRITK